MAGTKLQPDRDITDPLDDATTRDTIVQGTAAARERREDAAEAIDKAREAIAREAEAIAKANPAPERAGDILGLSDASPAVDIPQASRDHGGHPAGIEVRAPTTGTSELRQTSGATGMQIGAGVSGTGRDESPTGPPRRARI